MCAIEMKSARARCGARSRATQSRAVVEKNREFKCKGPRGSDADSKSG